jgi:hypothetical protein
LKESTYQIVASDHRCNACTTEIAPGEPYFSTVMFLEESFARRNYCEPCWPEASRQGVAIATPPETGSAQTALAEIFAFWKSARPLPTQKEARRFRMDPLVVLEFFRRLGDSVEADSEARSEAAAKSEQEFTTEDTEVRTEEPELGSDSDSDSVSASVPPGPSADQRRNLRFVLALLLIRKKVLIFGSSARRDDREWLQVKERAEPERNYWIENPELTDAELERVRDDIGELLQMQI